jgi:hypothetical protein
VCDARGQDLVLQAFSGLAAVNGQAPDSASPVGVSAVDHHGAALLAMGILAAPLHRHLPRISFQNVSRDNTELAILFGLHAAWFQVGFMLVTHMRVAIAIGKATGNLEYPSPESFEYTTGQIVRPSYLLLSQ